MMNWISDLRGDLDHAERLETDLTYFAEQYLRIRPKAGSLVPFVSLSCIGAWRSRKPRPAKSARSCSRPARWASQPTSRRDTTSKPSGIRVCEPSSSVMRSGQTLGVIVKKLILAFAALSILATAIPAKAGNCTTNCQRTYNGGSTCQTHCY